MEINFCSCIDEPDTLRQDCLSVSGDDDLQAKTDRRRLCGISNGWTSCGFPSVGHRMEKLFIASVYSLDESLKVFFIF